MPPEFNDFDPGEYEIQSVGAGDPHYELLRLVVGTVNEARPDGIAANDVSALLVQFMMQLRLWYKPDEFHAIVHQLMEITEANIHNAEWVNAETLKPTPPPILAEQVRDNPDGADMLAEYQAGLSDDDLTKLLDEEGS